MDGGLKMARKRMIDPKFWTDDKVMRISFPARLLFIGLWSHSDDLGVHRDDNYTLKAEVFALDNLTVEDVNKLKKELIDIGLILSFNDERDGNLLFIKNWFKYQYIKTPTPSKYQLSKEILKNFTSDELKKYHNRILDDDYRSSTVGLLPNRIEENVIKEKRVERPLTRTLLDKSLLIQLQKEYPTVYVDESLNKFYLNKASKGLVHKDEESAMRLWLQRDVDNGWNIRRVKKSVKMITLFCPEGHEKKQVHPNDEYNGLFCKKCQEAMVTKRNFPNHR